jgi:hypothetical protein
MLRTIKEEEEFKQCTFQPNKDKRLINPDFKETSTKLYDDAKRRIKVKQEGEKKEDSESFEYKPAVNRLYILYKFRNPLVFEINPILEDEQVKKETDRLERARIEKKLADLIKKKGVLNLRNFNDIESIVKEDRNLRPFDCSIEVKSNKDTFNIFRQEKRLTATSTSPVKKKYVQKSESPIPMLSINIDMGDRIEKINIYPQDDPMVIAEYFCTTHSNYILTLRYPR